MTGRTVVYSADSLYRLTQEQVTEAPNPVFTVRYAYDAVGDRTQMNRNGTITNYSYDTNGRLVTQVSGSVTLTSTYDDNGNLVSRSNGSSNTAYGYDSESRLVSVADPGGTVSFAYDADGMRTRKTVSGVTSTYLLDKNRVNAQVLSETAGATSTVYTYGGDQLISQTRSGVGAGSRFYLTDGQGSVRHLIDPSGAVTDGYSYDAFGVPLTTAGTTLNTYLYAGEQRDADIDLYYLRARYYDQSSGRFVSPDPLLGDPTRPMSLQNYLYADADPVDKADPSGQDVYVLDRVTGGFGLLGKSHWILAVDRRDGGLTFISFGPQATPIPEDIWGRVGDAFATSAQFFVSFDTRTGSAGVSEVTGEERAKFLEIYGEPYWGYYYFKTTPEEDDYARTLLPGMAGNYPYSLINQNCRAFARWAYGLVVAEIEQRRADAVRRRGTIGSILSGSPYESIANPDFGLQNVVPLF